MMRTLRWNMRALPFLALLVLLSLTLFGCSAKPTYAELQQKAQSINHDLLEAMVPGEVLGRIRDGVATAKDRDVVAKAEKAPRDPDVVAKVKKLLGAPYKEQALGETYYLYYRVQEGSAQVVVVGWEPEEGLHGTWVEAVNLL